MIFVKVQIKIVNTVICDKNIKCARYGKQTCFLFWPLFVTQLGYQENHHSPKIMLDFIKQYFQRMKFIFYFYECFCFALSLQLVYETSRCILHQEKAGQRCRQERLGIQINVTLGKQ